MKNLQLEFICSKMENWLRENADQQVNQFFVGPDINRFVREFKDVVLEPYEELLSGQQNSLSEFQKRISSLGSISDQQRKDVFKEFFETGKYIVPEPDDIQPRPEEKPAGKQIDEEMIFLDMLKDLMKDPMFKDKLSVSPRGSEIHLVRNSDQRDLFSIFYGEKGILDYKEFIIGLLRQFMMQFLEESEIDSKKIEENGPGDAFRLGETQDKSLEEIKKEQS